MTPRTHRRLTVLAAAVLSTAASLHAEQYVRYEHDGAVSWGRLDGSTIHQLDGAPYAGGSATGTTVAAADASLQAPVEPSKVFAVGLNYRSHLGSAEPAKEPPIFLKLPTSITGHEQPIVLPEGSENVHYEAELVLVVGKRLKNATPEEARDAIFGVTCGNDVSGRNWQRADLQWFRAKASDTFGPVGPAVVTGVDPDDLTLRGRHNGEVVQEQTTGDLLFGSVAIVSFISHYATIEAGDVIFTGTPGSTKALEPGDTFEVELKGVCKLSNPVEAAGG